MPGLTFTSEAQADDGGPTAAYAGRSRWSGSRRKTPPTQIAPLYAAAKRIGFSSIAVDSDERRALAAQLNEGQLLSGSKLLLPAIADELHQQLHEVLVKQTSVAEAGTPTDTETNATVKDGEPRVEQAPTETAAPTEAAPPTQVTVAAWNALIPGARVLAIYLDKRGNSDGWWEAEIVHIRDSGVFFLTWCDEPEAGVFMRHREQIALLLPSA